MNNLKNRLDKLAVALDAQETASILVWFEGLTTTQQGTLRLAIDHADIPPLTDQDRAARIVAILDRAAGRRDLTGLEHLSDRELEDIVNDE